MVAQYFSGPFYQHWDFTSDTSVFACRQLLADVIRTHGPFDGVVGGCEGSSVAASTIIHVANAVAAGPEAVPELEGIQPFRFAVFLSGIPSIDVSGRRRLDVKSTQGSLIHIPSFHVGGR